MYSVNVRSHVMIAHSLPAEVFGPAARLHGATYVVDAEFRRAELDAFNVVIDIGLASRVLGEVTAALGYRNLDEDPRFAAALTTTEYLARFLHGEIARRVAADFAGVLKVTLHESHVAWAAFEGPVGPAAAKESDARG
ncbi:MAG TPA: 6-carboxytetrahydropterin synthase [Thermoanaerobaculia bacterium]|jgi:6-pyruvoyl-tetrahydropterin synthase|nr:6-carboxytetrahydropterin synthase [Thermoanaerobaculia bacterium]